MKKLAIGYITFLAALALTQHAYGYANLIKADEPNIDRQQVNFLHASDNCNLMQTQHIDRFDLGTKELVCK